MSANTDNAMKSLCEAREHIRREMVDRCMNNHEEITDRYLCTTQREIDNAIEDLSAGLEDHNEL